MLRKPQLQSVKANVEAAKASLEQAKLNLQRTTVRAPFDAHIISRSVNVGSQVAQGANLGRLVGRDEYWVVVTVPVSKLNWLSFSENDDGKGSMVRIRNRSAWPEGHYRQGRLFRLIGALEDQTRMARVLVSVPDPLAYQTDSAEVPRLMLGSFVETSIEAREIKDVVRLSRDYLRQDETVWVMKDGKLRIRKVQIEFEDPQYAYISDGLNQGEQVVTTNLSTVVDGSRLRTEGQKMTTEKDTTQGAQSAAQASGNTP
ncbi:MAG: efflux RND transporter periplasmic adaptor subunit [Owenweeksia sp.]|nr:efflux RND transporter periplasmic adaptor subunit [Owenweeksia sp.]